MIIQEIKLHPEPLPYTPPVKTGEVIPFNTKPIAQVWSYTELAQLQKDAIAMGINIGTKWKYKGSDVYIIVQSWNITPAYVTICNDQPCIIRAQRKSPFDNTNSTFVFNYSIEELLEMEKM